MKPRYYLATVAFLLIINLSAIAEDRPRDRYLLLSTERTSTMQRELDEAVERGYRVVAGSQTHNNEIAYLLERSEEVLPRSHYLLLATKRLATMEREMNEAASRGHRLLPETVLWDCDDLVLLMEPAGANERPWVYKVLATHRTTTLEREINEAASAGFHVARMIATEENVVIMERRGAR